MKLWRILVVAGISGVLAGASTLNTPTQATTFTGMNGAIAFTKTVRDTTHIWRMNAKGRHEQLLTYREAHTPAWAPNGRKLVFVDGRGQLQTINANGTDRSEITRGQGTKDSTPVWSPDGSHIAFVRKQTSNQQSAIFTIQPNGQHERNITGWTSAGGYRTPSWAPEGTRLVYEHFVPGSSSKLFIKDIKDSGAKEKELAMTSEEIPSRPLWSPDGKRILFSDSASEMYTIWPDGSHRTVISDGDSRGGTWSPDGTKIAFIEDNNINVSGVDGTVKPVLPSEGAYRNIDNLLWSPDGAKLLFTGSTDHTRGSLSGLFSIKTQGRDAVPSRLADGDITEPDWQAKP